MQMMTIVCSVHICTLYVVCRVQICSVQICTFSGSGIFIYLFIFLNLKTLQHFQGP